MNKIAAILMIGIISYGVYAAFSSTQPGSKPFKRKAQNDVSRAYLAKTVNGKKHSSIMRGMKGLENSSSNIVTAVVLDYRGFDTLGEVTVLFAAIAGIGLLLGGQKKRVITPAGPIISSLAPWIALFILITSAYVFLHGHLTPGGGFPGGAMIAAGFLLMVLGFRTKPSGVFRMLESFAGLSFVLVGLLGFLKKGSFLQNFMGTGEMGSLFGSLFITVLYAIIGIKVAAELSSGFGSFVKEDLEEEHE
ncbi:MAG: cation:proton antiporter [Deltaproteobacteria bacterium]|nr:cation:proton antiporter [Deltaproteobacteria bacterium]